MKTQSVEDYGVKSVTAPVRPTMSGHQMIAALVARGVTKIFGIPGGAASSLIDGMLDYPELDYVVTRHECTAAFAAMGHAKRTGEPGVVLVTSGPGTLNTVNAVAAAHNAGVPLLVLGGEVSQARFGQGALQDGSHLANDLVGLMAKVTKLSFQITSADCAVASLIEAWTCARTPKRGAVYLSLPINLTRTQSLPAAVSCQREMSYGADARTMAQIADRLLRSKKTMILLGNGGYDSDLTTNLASFAQHTNAYIATTPAAKGMFPEDHPRSLGVFGSAGHASAFAYADDCLDTLLVLGSGLGEVDTDGWRPSLASCKTLIQVDVDLRHIGRSYRVDQAICLPVDQFIAEILGVIETISPGSRQGAATNSVAHAKPAAASSSPTTQASIEMGISTIQHLAAPRTQIPRLIDPEKSPLAASGRLAIGRVYWELQQIVDATTIYTVDSGNHLFQAVHYLEITGPNRFITTLGDACSMGSALGLAIGAKCASPCETVVCIVGDGGLAMTLGELATLASESLAIIVLVINDGGLGMCNTINPRIYQRGEPWKTGPMDVCQIARACGIATARVSKPNELLGLREKLRGLHGPLVIDAHVDEAFGEAHDTRRRTLQAHTASSQEPS